MNWPRIRGLDLQINPRGCSLRPYSFILRNIREFITAYGIIVDKIRTSKNNLIRALDMMFAGLSNAIEIDSDTPDMWPVT